MNHGLRIIDANLNRAREGLRLMEEHARMTLADAELSHRLKNLRHELAPVVDSLGADRLLAARDVERDVGTTITHSSEQTRANLAEIVSAAAKRVQEALRVIEEHAKIDHPGAAALVEQIRYRAYAVEQELLIGGPRRARLRRAVLHVLLTESLCAKEWEDTCSKVLGAGADVIQLREKKLPDATLIQRALTVRRLTARHDALLIVNDRPDIAVLADADGVHLGQDDLPVRLARKVVGPHRLIGKSIHSIEEARAALAEAPDYISVGPMFASSTKPEVRVQGPDLLIRIAESCRLPMVALGGITVEGAGRLRLALPRAVSQITPDESREVDPATRSSVQIAVCHAILSAADPAAATRAIRMAWAPEQGR